MIGDTNDLNNWKPAHYPMLTMLPTTVGGFQGVPISEGLCKCHNSKYSLFTGKLRDIDDLPLI